MSEYRLFFALWPDERLRERMFDAARKLPHAGPRAYRVKPDRYHITLLFLGEADGATLERARDAADTVRAAPFELTVDRAGSFPRARVWWLGCSTPSPALIRLWQGLHEAADRAGLSYDAERMTPHVTVTRETREAFAPKPIAPIHWRVREFALINSVLSPKTSYYEVLGRWPLAESG